MVRRLPSLLVALACVVTAAAQAHHSAARFDTSREVSIDGVVTSYSWEGHTLVVDTVNFADHREGTALGIPSGPGKRLLERISLAGDRKHLEYEVRMEDPEYLVEPVTFGARWEYRPDLQPSGEPCDLDVVRRYRSE